MKAVHRKGLPRHFFPETREELLELEAMAIEAGRARSVKVLCPLCGANYFAGHGHLDSDVCRVVVNVRAERERGNVAVNRNLTRLLDDAGVEHHVGIGALEAPTKVELDVMGCKLSELYKGFVARDRMFAAVWAERTLDATKRSRYGTTNLPRRRRVFALSAVHEIPRLQEVIAGLDERWEREVFRDWLLPIVASAGDTSGDVKDCLMLEHDELLAALSRRHLELRAQRGAPS